jgi:hypothetical protein
MIDVEAESREIRERSAELAELLDGGHPVLDRTHVREVAAESRRLAREARQARQRVAAQIATGAGAPCVIGRQPPVRRVRTDPRTGRDLDPLAGKSAVTAELLAFWEHQRDIVAPAVEASYREAAERTPYQPALVASARQHVSLLKSRETMLDEGGVELEASVARYDEAYVNLRQAAVDAQAISGEAETRLQSLKRIEAEALLGDGDDERGFLANAISSVTPTGLVDPATAMPLVPDSSRATPRANQYAWQES